MDQIGFFEATVPVFQHYLAQLDGMLGKLSPTHPEKLAIRLVPDTFTAGEHFRTAQGFVLRTIYPLIGEAVPELPTDEPTLRALLQRSDTIRSLVEPLTKEHFEGAAMRTIDHKAGTAALSQGATQYLTLFALPNFFFHLTMGYATLRQQGVEVGKADFDGHHRYPEGFRLNAT